MTDRRLPIELAVALRAVWRVERAAVNEAQRSRAIGATSRLLLAAVEAGWQVTEVAPVAGLNRHAASKRLNRTRRISAAAAGIEVEPPLPAVDRLAALRRPVSEREWLTTREASQYAGVGYKALHNWLQGGLLPNTDRRGAVYLVLKADLDRVVRAPRYNGQGVHWAAVRAVIEGTTI